MNIDDFSAVEALAAEAEASGSISTWGVDVSGTLFTEMRDSDPNAALRESALPTLLTYTGHEGILSDTTQAETIAAVESLPDGRAVLEPFAEGNHNYLSEDAATAAASGDDSGVFGGVFKITPGPHKDAPYTAFRILFTVCCIGSMSFSPPDTGTFCSFQSRCCLK